MVYDNNGFSKFFALEISKLFVVFFAHISSFLPEFAKTLPERHNSMEKYLVNVNPEKVLEEIEENVKKIIQVLGNSN
jgi:hypothetical protein